MLKACNFKFFQNKIIHIVIFLFIISFFFEQYLKLEFSFLNFSVVEIVFLILFFLNLLIYKFNFIKFISKVDKKNIFELIIYSILILKLIKYSLNYQNFYNLYELCIWIYMLCIYLTFKFYINKNIINTIYLENSFIILSAILSLHIFYSFCIFKLGYDSNNLWYYNDERYYPYYGFSNVKFTSLFEHQNAPAHLVVPGFIFIINRYDNKKIYFFLLCLFILVLYLIKSKFLILFFGILLILFISKYFNLAKHRKLKITFLSIIILLSLFYLILTHFLILEKNTINSSNLDYFKHFYFIDYHIPFKNFDIYGSLFLKLKYTAISIAQNTNYIFFNDLNWFKHEIVLNNFNNYQDPHSDYFGALANYGIFGFLIYLSLPVFIIFQYVKKFDYERTKNKSYIYFLTILLYLIEALIVDILHTQFVWIILAMYLQNIKIEKKISL